MRSRLLFLALALVLTCSCAASDPKDRADDQSSEAPVPIESPSPTPAKAKPVNDPPYEGYPDSIAAIGHSGLTGESSDPKKPGLVALRNSWATGTNPTVDSIYLRILAENPKIEGNNFNYAVGGATVYDLIDQAEVAVSQETLPDLVIVQTMDNDILCPVTQSDLDTFREAFVSALQILADGAPGARFFVVSQLGSPTSYLNALNDKQRKEIGGFDPCSIAEANGNAVPKELARLARVVHAYEKQLAEGCRQFNQCRYDNGALARTPYRPEYVTPDLNHLTVAGLKKVASVAWKAMESGDLVR